MKIIIIGAGFTGLQLARRLVSEKIDVVLIDNDEETVRHASDRVDCLVVHANGNSLETLKAAGIAKAFALVALTESDELNMITCSLVDSVYPDVIKIARVRNYDYYANSDLVQAELPDSEQAAAQGSAAEVRKRKLYGIDYMIQPDLEAAQAVVSAVEHGAVASILEFEGSSYDMTSLEIEENSKLDGCRVQDIKPLAPFTFLIPVVSSGGTSFLPKGDTILKAGDRISLLIEKKNLKYFLELTGSNTHEIKRIMLIGAGRIGTGIAEQILYKPAGSSFFSRFFDKKVNKRVKLVIIDNNKELTKEAEARFPEASVLHADITDESFIEEENLSTFDLVIAATRNHELNIVSAAYLKTLGCSKSICLVTNSSFAAIANDIGIDVSVPIKDTIVDSILSHLRGKNVTGVHTLQEGLFEVVEYEVAAGSAVQGKALKDLRGTSVPFLILLVKKDDVYTIPSGDTVLEEGDQLVFIVGTDDSKQLLDKFGA